MKKECDFDPCYSEAVICFQILISADDEMEESDAEEDLRRLTNLKPIKKKKHRFGLPV